MMLIAAAAAAALSHGHGARHGARHWSIIRAIVSSAIYDDKCNMQYICGAAAIVCYHSYVYMYIITSVSAA